MATASPARRTAAAAALTAILAVVAAACSGSEADKAGGSIPGRPVVLTLGVHEPYDAVEFAEAVERLSGGSIRVRVKPLGSQPRVGFAKTVADVRAHKVDLALIPVRVWDTMGVTSFRALVAPFLVDSLALERRVLQDSVVLRMLAGVEKIGLAGVAVVPGPLRRPLGTSRPLVRREDYEGATIGIGPGRVAEATFRALGATGMRVAFPTRYHPTWTTGLDGSEVDLRTALTSSAASSLTANVVFWPDAQMIFASREAFDSLDPSQRDLLRHAGREAVAPLITRLELDESQLLSAVCGPAMAPALVTAPYDARAAVQKAVRNVYSELLRDPGTRELIAEIRNARRRLAPGPTQLACPASRPWTRPSGSVLDGVWRATLSRKELLAAGVSSQQVDECPDCDFMTLELENGRWFAALGKRLFSSGTFTVEGRVLRVKGETCSPDPCAPFTEQYTWSRYRDTLSFARIPGRQFWQVMIAATFKRVR